MAIQKQQSIGYVTEEQKSSRSVLAAERGAPQGGGVAAVGVQAEQRLREGGAPLKQHGIKEVLDKWVAK